jgi:acyl dehydratase
MHGLFTGVDLHCHRPVMAGQRVIARQALHDVVERTGRYAGSELQQVYRTTYHDQDGNLLSTLYSHAFRTDRQKGGKSTRFASLERQHYDDAALAEITSQYREERKIRKGAQPRFFDDVNVGDKVGPVVKGPLTVTDCICFLIGFGYIFVKAHRQWNEFLERHPGAGVKDSFGVWDVPERVHWEEDLPKKIGMPTAYDYGPQRIGWFDHCISDWMGDDGWIRRLNVRLTAPNFIGDTTRIHGEVSGKSPDESVVELDLRAEDQRARVTATAKAEVELPRRSAQ